MNRNILSSLLAVGLLASCAPKKLIVTPPPAVVTQPATTNKTEENIALLRSKNFAFNTLVLKGKAHLNMDGDENNVNINIRIKNNEMIWVSVSAIIGEVARVSITPDSIRIINRLQNTYTKKPFDFVKQFSSSKITFGMLQDILSGNLIVDLLNPETKAEQQAGMFTVSGSADEVAYTFLFNTLLRVQETDLNHVRAAQALKVNYSDYHQLEVGLFPTTIEINSLAGMKKNIISLNLSSIEGNVPVEFPFTVKPHFKVIN